MSLPSVINAVEALQEYKAVDEVETLPAWAAHIGDDEIDLALLASENGVHGAGPDLGVCGELVLCGIAI